VFVCFVGVLVIVNEFGVAVFFGMCLLLFTLTEAF